MSFTIGGGAKNRCAVTAVDFLETDNGEAAYRLDEEFGITTRSGLHCAPKAHETLGTFPRGVVRFSFGHKNTEKEVDILLKALEKF
jgi:selenocysteine lyase/cysteine desulfurase